MLVVIPDKTGWSLRWNRRRHFRRCIYYHIPIDHDAIERVLPAFVVRRIGRCELEAALVQLTLLVDRMVVVISAIFGTFRLAEDKRRGRREILKNPRRWLNIALLQSGLIGRLDAHQILFLEIVPVLSEIVHCAAFFLLILQTRAVFVRVLAAVYINEGIFGIVCAIADR